MRPVYEINALRKTLRDKRVSLNMSQMEAGRILGLPGTPVNRQGILSRFETGKMDPSNPMNSVISENAEKLLSMELSSATGNGTQSDGGKALLSVDFGSGLRFDLKISETDALALMRDFWNKEK